MSLESRWYSIEKSSKRIIRRELLNQIKQSLPTATSGEGFLSYESLESFWSDTISQVETDHEEKKYPLFWQQVQSLGLADSWQDETDQTHLVKLIDAYLSDLINNPNLPIEPVISCYAKHQHLAALFIHDDKENDTNEHPLLFSYINSKLFYHTRSGIIKAELSPYYAKLREYAVQVLDDLIRLNGLIGELAEANDEENLNALISNIQPKINTILSQQSIGSLQLNEELKSDGERILQFIQDGIQEIVSAIKTIDQLEDDIIAHINDQTDPKDVQQFIAERNTWFEKTKDLLGLFEETFQTEETAPIITPLSLPPQRPEVADRPSGSPEEAIRQKVSQAEALWPSAENNRYETWTQIKIEWLEIAHLWQAQNNEVEKAHALNMAEYANTYMELFRLEQPQNYTGLSEGQRDIYNSHIQQLEQVLNSPSDFLNNESARITAKEIIRKANLINRHHYVAHYVAQNVAQMIRRLSDAHEITPTAASSINAPSYLERVLTLRNEVKKLTEEQKQNLKILSAEPGYRALLHLLTQDTQPTQWQIVQNNFNDNWGTGFCFDELENEVRYAISAVPHPRLMAGVELKQLYQTLAPTARQLVADYLKSSANGEEINSVLQSQNWLVEADLHSNPLFTSAISLDFLSYDIKVISIIDQGRAEYRYLNDEQRREFEIQVNELSADGSVAYARGILAGLISQNAAISKNDLERLTEQANLSHIEAAQKEISTVLWETIFASYPENPNNEIQEAVLKTLLTENKITEKGKALLAHLQQKGSAHIAIVAIYQGQKAKNPNFSIHKREASVIRDLARQTINTSDPENIISITQYFARAFLQDSNSNEGAAIWFNVSVLANRKVKDKLSSDADFAKQLARDYPILVNYLVSYLSRNAMATKAKPQTPKQATQAVVPKSQAKLILDPEIAEKLALIRGFINEKEYLQEFKSNLVSIDETIKFDNPDDDVIISANVSDLEEQIVTGLNNLIAHAENQLSLPVPSREDSDINQLIEYYESLRQQANLSLQKEIELVMNKETDESPSAEPKATEPVAKSTLPADTKKQQLLAEKSLLTDELEELRQIIAALPSSYPAKAEIEEKWANIAELFKDTKSNLETQLSLINMEMADLAEKLPAQEIRVAQKEYKRLQSILSELQAGKGREALAQQLHSIDFAKLSSITDRNLLLQELAKVQRTFESIEQSLRAANELDRETLEEDIWKLEAEYLQVQALGNASIAGNLLACREALDALKVNEFPTLSIKDWNNAGVNYAFLYQEAQAQLAKASIDVILDLKDADSAFAKLTATSIDESSLRKVLLTQLIQIHVLLQLTETPRAVHIAALNGIAWKILNAGEDTKTLQRIQSACEELALAVDTDLSAQEMQHILAAQQKLASLENTFNRFPEDPKFQIDFAAFNGELKAISQMLENKQYTESQKKLEAFLRILSDIEEGVRKKEELYNENIESAKIAFKQVLTEHKPEKRAELKTKMLAQSSYAGSILSAVLEIFNKEFRTASHDIRKMELLLMEFSWLITNIILDPAMSRNFSANEKKQINIHLREYIDLAISLVDQHPSLLFQVYLQLRTIDNSYTPIFNLNKPISPDAFAKLINTAQANSAHGKIFKLSLAKSLANSYADTIYPEMLNFLLDSAEQDLDKSILENLLRRPEIKNQLKKDKKLQERFEDVYVKAIAKTTQQLVDLNFHLISKIQAWDFSSNEKKSANHVSLWNLISNIQSGLDHYIPLKICSEANADVRYLQFIGWISTAAGCVEQGDFNSAFHIFSALSNTQVDRLLQGQFNYLPKSIQSQFRSLTQLFDPSGNMKAYREALKVRIEENLPAVPIIAVTSKDLTNAKDGIERNVTRGSIQEPAILSERKLLETLDTFGIFWGSFSNALPKRIDPEMQSLVDKMATTLQSTFIDEHTSDDSLSSIIFHGHIQATLHEDEHQEKLKALSRTILPDLRDAANLVTTKTSIRDLLRPQADEHKPSDLAINMAKEGVKAAKVTGPGTVPEDIRKNREEIFKVYSALLISSKALNELRIRNGSVEDLYKLDSKNYLSNCLKLINLHAQIIPYAEQKLEPKIEEILAKQVSLQKVTANAIRRFLLANPNYKNALLAKNETDLLINDPKALNVLKQMGFTDSDSIALLLLADSIRDLPLTDGVESLRDGKGSIIDLRSIVEFINSSNVHLLYKADALMELLPELTDSTEYKQQLLQVKQDLKAATPDISAIEANLNLIEEELTLKIHELKEQRDTQTAKILNFLGNKSLIERTSPDGAVNRNTVLEFINNKDLSARHLAGFVSLFIQNYVEKQLEALAKNPNTLNIYMEFQWIFDNIFNNPRVKRALKAAEDVDAISEVRHVLDRYKAIGERAANQTPELLYQQFIQLQDFATAPYFYSPNYQFNPPLNAKTLETLLNLAEREQRIDVVEMLLRRPDVIKAVDKNPRLLKKVIRIQKNQILQMGKELIALEFSISSRFSPRDFYDLSRNTTREVRTPWSQATELTQRLTNFVALSILKEPDINVRNLRLAQWVLLAQYCVDQGALSMANAIQQALGLSSIMKLLNITLEQEHDLSASILTSIATVAGGEISTAMSKTPAVFAGTELHAKLSTLVEKLTFSNDPTAAYNQFLSSLLEKSNLLSPVIPSLITSVTFAVESGKDLAPHWGKLSHAQQSLQPNEAILQGSDPTTHPLMSTSWSRERTREMLAQDSEYVGDFFQLIEQSNGEYYSLSFLPSMLAHGMVGVLPDAKLNAINVINYNGDTEYPTILEKWANNQERKKGDVLFVKNLTEGIWRVILFKTEQNKKISADEKIIVKDLTMDSVFVKHLNTMEAGKLLKAEEDSLRTLLKEHPLFEEYHFGENISYNGQIGLGNYLLDQFTNLSNHMLNTQPLTCGIYLLEKIPSKSELATLPFETDSLYALTNDGQIIFINRKENSIKKFNELYEIAYNEDDFSKIADKTAKKMSADQRRSFLRYMNMDENIRVDSGQVICISNNPGAQIRLIEKITAYNRPQRSNGVTAEQVLSANPIKAVINALENDDELNNSNSPQYSPAIAEKQQQLFAHYTRVHQQSEKIVKKLGNPLADDKIKAVLKTLYPAFDARWKDVNTFYTTWIKDWLRVVVLTSELMGKNDAKLSPTVEAYLSSMNARLAHHLRRFLLNISNQDYLHNLENAIAQLQAGQNLQLPQNLSDKLNEWNLSEAQKAGFLLLYHSDALGFKKMAHAIFDQTTNENLEKVIAANPVDELDEIIQGYTQEDDDAFDTEEAAADQEEEIETKAEQTNPALTAIIDAYRAGKDKLPEDKLIVSTIAQQVRPAVKNLLAIPAITADLTQQRKGLAAVRDEYYAAHAIPFTYEREGKQQKGYIFAKDVKFSSMQTLLRMVDYAEGALLIIEHCDADATTKKQLSNRVMQTANAYMQELLNSGSYDTKEDVKKSIKLFEKYTAELAYLVQDHTIPKGLLSGFMPEGPETKSWAKAVQNGEAGFKNLQKAAALAAMERGYNTIASVLEDQDGETFISISTPLSLPEKTWEEIKDTEDHQGFAINYGPWLDNAYAKNAAIYSSTPFPTHQRDKGAANIREEQVYVLKTDGTTELLFENTRTGFITPKDQRNKKNRQEQAKAIFKELIALRYEKAQKAYAETFGKWLDAGETLLPIFYQTLVTPNLNEQDEGIVNKIIDRRFFYEEAGATFPIIGFVGWDSEAELIEDKMQALAAAMLEFDVERKDKLSTHVYSTNHAISTRQKLSGLMENTQDSVDLIKLQAAVLSKLASSRKFSKRFKAEDQSELEKSLNTISRFLDSNLAVDKNLSSPQMNLQKLHAIMYAPIKSKPFKTAEDRALMDLFIGMQSAVYLKALLDLDLSKADSKKALPLFDKAGEFFTAADGTVVQIPDEFKGLEGNKRFLRAVYEQIMMYGLKALLLGSCKSSADRFGIILTYITALRETAYKNNGWLLAPAEDLQLRSTPTEDGTASYNAQRHVFHTRFERLVKLGHAHQVVADNNSTAALKSGELSDDESLTNKVLESRKKNESEEVKKEKLLSKLRKDGFDEKHFHALIEKETSLAAVALQNDPDLIITYLAAGLNTLQQTLAHLELTNKLLGLRSYIKVKFNLVNRYIQAYLTEKEFNYLASAGEEINKLQSKIEAFMRTASVPLPVINGLPQYNMESLLSLAKEMNAKLTAQPVSSTPTALAAIKATQADPKVMLHPLASQLSTLQQTLTVFNDPATKNKLLGMRPFTVATLRKIDNALSAAADNIKGNHFLEIDTLLKKLQHRMDVTLKMAGIPLPVINKNHTIQSDIPGLSATTKAILHKLVYGSDVTASIRSQMEEFYTHGGTLPTKQDSYFEQVFYKCPLEVLHITLNGLAHNGIALSQNIVVGGTQGPTVGLVLIQLADYFHKNLLPDQSVQQQVAILDQLLEKIFMHTLDIIKGHSNPYHAAHFAAGSLFQKNEGLQQIQAELQLILSQWHALYKLNFSHLPEPENMPKFVSLFEPGTDLQRTPSDNLILLLKHDYQMALTGARTEASSTCAQEAQEASEILRRESQGGRSILGH